MPKPNQRDQLKAEFATRLGRLLTEKGWNQSDLARAASQHLPKGEEFRRDNIHVYLNETALPRPKQLNAIAAALNVAAEDLLPGVAHAKGSMPVAMRAIPRRTRLRMAVSRQKSNDADSFGCSLDAGGLAWRGACVAYRA